MSAPAIELRDVWLSRRGVPVLEGVDLVVEHNDFLALLGPNGSGKTTLLHVVLGLLEPDRGSVRVLGASPRAARGRVGYVPQHAHFDRHFPIHVNDVVRMGGLGKRRPRARERALVRRLLERLEIADLAERPIGQLSGGQLQRVLIARALAVEPELLLLDEPTASLDERMEHDVWGLLDELSRELTVVVVSHDIGAVVSTVRSVACLNRRLLIHESRKLTPELLEATYGGSIALVAHHDLAEAEAPAVASETFRDRGAR